jgi:bifunctional non-homologous end joining protein LigD
MKQNESRDEARLRFVVQKHAARRLHYDFRLEVDGVLKSWAVPKGPSVDPADKRLATMVEDHALQYGSFEGEIPEGGYGAGQVIVWDRGSYIPEDEGKPLPEDREAAEEIVRRGLARGKLTVHLDGEKLKGSWALVKMRRGENDWLLIKHRDEHADPTRDILADGRSVISGVTIEDLRSGR